jgi:Na+/proline symporter
MTQLILYSLVMLVLVIAYEWGKTETTERFLVADRKVKLFTGSMSVAATWIWAPAIFISSQVGYEWGFSGLVWFSIPNVLTLLFFGFFSKRIRGLLPEGFSYIQFLKKDKSGFRNSQLTIQLAVQIVAFALQLTAGAQLLSFVSGASYLQIIVVMTIAPLLYSLISGLSSSIFTDWIQYLMILSAIIFIYFGLPQAKDFNYQMNFNFNPLDLKMLKNFGIASCLTLIFGVFSDHQHWQRIFAVEKDKVSKVYTWAGVFHFLVTFSLGTLGVILASSGFSAENHQLVVVGFLNSHLPEIFTIIFIWMALCGLCSTLDSALCAFASLYVTEISKSSEKIKVGRTAMCILAIAGLVIAYFQISLITLWWIIGILRLVSLPPTLASVFDKKFSGKFGTSAIAISALLGGPVFIYGSMTKNPWLNAQGMIICLAVSTIIYSLKFIPKNLKLQLIKIEGETSKNC